MSWLVDQNALDVNVFPDTDEQEHVMGPNCWCRPEVEENRGSLPVVVHRDELDRLELDG